MPTDPRTEFVLGRRIMVRGVTGSGKSTFARQLGDILVPAIELDALFWRPNWQEPPRDEFRDKVTEALAGCPDGWICDGGYSGVLGDLVISQAETAIWLHLPLRVTFPRCSSAAWFGS